VPPASSHPLPPPVIEIVAAPCRVLGEPMRIRLLEALRDGDASVQDLTAWLGGSQQNVPQHLGGLRRQASTLSHLLGNVRAA